MIILGYIGNHDKDTLTVRLGWALIRLVREHGAVDVTEQFFKN